MSDVENVSLTAGIEELEKQLLNQRELVRLVDESDTLIRQIINLASDGIVFYDKVSDEVIEVNNALINKLKYKREEVIGKNVSQFIIQKQLSGVSDEVTDNSLRYVTIVDRNGKGFECEVSTNSGHYRGRDVKISAFVDVSNKESIKDYQENLSFLSKSALNFLTLSSDDDIFIFVGKILSKFASKSIVAVFSYDQITNISNIRYISGIYPHINELVEILGKTPEEFDITIPAKFRNKYLSDKTLKEINGGLNSIVEDSDWNKEKACQIQKLLKTGYMYSMGMARDGKLYGGLVIATENRTGTINSQTIETFIYQAGIALHRKHIDNELVKAKLLAEESDRLKSSFLANMSHEIRTPLNGILGLAQVMLKSEQLAPVFRNDVKMIIESGNTLLTLIEDIIDISKIEAGQLKINKRPFVLNSLMDQLYSIFSVNPVFQKKNAARDIVLKYDKPCENITIISDPDRLKQIFVNLIGNALKFTQEGYVHFGYLIENDEIIFYVKDSGIGIPKSQTGKIFERFMQIDTTLSRKYGGSGLGLAISHGLISLLNGKIWCISDLGKGSNFFFTIPCQSVPPLKNTETPHKKDSTVHDWSDYTALIVEDDVINFKVIEAMLRATKVNIIHAEDGLKAIEQARLNTRIDIVLMDVHIPEINGLEASSKILEFRPELPIIAQTANAMSDDRDKCIEAGCVDYISKPINMNDLFARMSKFLPDRE